MMTDRFEIRKAVEADLGVVFSFIKELAEYERLSHEVTATEETLRSTLFGPQPSAEVLIAYFQQQPVGFAIYFQNYSTFLGRPGIYLEDLFVKPEFRGRGFGRAMVVHLARIAKERNCGRFEWSVLNWNEPSIKFYKVLGAQPLSDWTVFRVSGEALDRLAGQETKGVIGNA